MVAPNVAADSILRKLSTEAIRTIGVCGRWGFFQEDIREQLKSRSGDGIEIVEFDVWNYSDSGDLVFTMLGSIAEKARARKQVAEEAIKKIGKVLTYIGAGALLKASSGVSIGDIEKAFQSAEEGIEMPALNIAEQARARLRQFFDDGAEGKLVVLVSNLEKADKPQIESVFNAVRYLGKASRRLFFVIFFDDSHESPEATSKMLRLCDSLIHLPHVTKEALAQGVLREFQWREWRLDKQEISDLEYFLSEASEIRNLSREAIERTIRHFEASLEIVRGRTFARLYFFVLALKYQYPEAYRWIMESRFEVFEAWLDKNRDARELMDSIGRADSLYYPDLRQEDWLVRLRQAINEGERFGI